MNEPSDLKLRVAALEVEVAALKADIEAGKRAQIKAAWYVFNDPTNAQYILENENQPLTRNTEAPGAASQSQRR